MKNKKQKLTGERKSERAMRESRKPQKTFKLEEWYWVLEKFVESGNCLIDDVYGVHKIDSVSLVDNSKGKPTGIIFKSRR